MNEEAYELTAKLCREFEGLRLERYKCPAGYWTIGYGHRCSANQPPIDLSQAEDFLKQDILEAYSQLIQKSPGLASARPGQIAALTDFVFNIGIGRYEKSTLRKYVDDQEWSGAPGLLAQWVIGGGKKLAGLVKRRNAEVLLLESST